MSDDEKLAEALREAAEIMRHALDIATDDNYPHSASVMNSEQALAAALRALDAAGWQCVPKVATEAMKHAGESAASVAIGKPIDDDAVPRVWTAMLAAAPKPGGAQGGGA